MAKVIFIISSVRCHCQVPRPISRNLVGVIHVHFFSYGCKIFEITFKASLFVSFHNTPDGLQ